MKRKLFILLTFSVTTGLCLSQTISKKTQNIVNSLIKSNEVHCSLIYEGGLESDQYKTYQKLSETATDNELIKLTDHSNGVVRCYAFQCLGSRSNVDIFPILLKHLPDETPITTFCGCIQMTELVGDYFLLVVTDGTIMNGGFKLTQTQRNTVDSILIFNHEIKLYAKESLLSTIEPFPKYHDQIRQIALNEKMGVAALALAKYNDPIDIPIIKDFFNNKDSEYYAICAAREFPDSAFYPFLVEIFERTWEKKHDYRTWGVIYQALAKYPQQKTYELFKRTTELTDSFLYQKLCTNLIIAITKYPNDLFEPLKNEIKLDRNHQAEVNHYMNY